VATTMIWLFLYIRWRVFFVTTDDFWRPLTDLRALVDPIVPRRLRSLAQLRPLTTDRHRLCPSHPLRSKMVSLFWWLDLQHRVLYAFFRMRTRLSYIYLFTFVLF